MSDVEDDDQEFIERIFTLEAKLKIAIEALEKLDTGWNKNAVREALDKIKTVQKVGYVAMEKQIKELQDKLRLAIEALEFYADERNKVMVQVPPTRGWVPGGRKAQDAVDKITTDQKEGAE